MASLLEELKQQREQIKKHLEWLDRKIAELSKGDVNESAENSAVPLPPENDPETKPLEEAKNKSSSFEPDPDAPTYKESTQGELRRGQFGCLALFILSCALFLFLLFGLPYLLPEKVNGPESKLVK